METESETVFKPPFKVAPHLTEQGVRDVIDSDGKLRFSFGGKDASKRARAKAAELNAEVEPVTPVIFRRWPMDRAHDAEGRIYWTGGDVVAIFPTLPGTSESCTCSSYEHVGQHGNCDGRGFINRTILATPEQYADLKAELEAQPYGYRLKVYKRWQPDFDTARYKAFHT